MNFKQVLILFLTLTLAFSSSLFAAEGSAKKPAVKKGAEVTIVSGTLVNWSDIEKIDLATFGTNERKLKPIMNFQNPRKIKKKSKDNDPVVQDSFGDLERGGLSMPTPTNHFAGMNFSSNGAGWPPDTNGDVGPTYFIQTVNTSIGIYNKSTGALVSATTFDAFFGGSEPCNSNNNGDPIVLYDRYSQRWFILDFSWSGTSNGSYYSIAVSQTSNPTGSWWQYCLHADNTYMNDYPKCGIWDDGIYVTANMFNFSTQAFQHVKVWAFKKPDIYSGTLTVQSLTDSSYQAWSLLPANAKSSTAPASSKPHYMIAMDADEYGGSSIDALYLWKWAIDWSNSSNSTWTGPTTMNTAAFGLTASRIPQQGTSNTLDSLYGRLMFPAFYRNFGTYEALYVCHVCEYSSRRAMRWYEVRINSSGTPSIYQQGTYAPDTNHRWMGAIGADKNGNVAMGYSISSTSMYPSIRYAGRLSTDTLGQLAQGEATMVSGGGYQSSYTRWGDYSSMTIDPDDDETFWYTQEYYTSSGTNWQTRIGSFKFSTTPDTTPPVITNVQATNIQANQATITWTTDESADSKVDYGTTTSYGSSQSSGSMVTNHSITLTGLSASTLYHYKVTSVDGSSNSASSNDYTFTTAASGGNPEIYVYNIAMQKFSSFFGLIWRAEGTITIRDTDGNAVQNATVYITWSGKASGSSSGATNSSGQITFSSGSYWGNGTFTITVTNVTHATLQYNSSLNNETSDSI